MVLVPPPGAWCTVAQVPGAVPGVGWSGTLVNGALVHCECCTQYVFWSAPVFSGAVVKIQFSV